ncbi:hypothetical protein BKA70DRAFT_1294774 [Coprinopsis sp. MPI-PUGE-AT-0042]|nr:hypothetical protein BKA70DRAFT_1294774 [Coprinopsis sp. MPI-PUGE-AT-0042]
MRARKTYAAAVAAVDRRRTMNPLLRERPCSITVSHLGNPPTASSRGRSRQWRFRDESCLALSSHGLAFPGTFRAKLGPTEPASKPLINWLPFSQIPEPVSGSMLMSLWANVLTIIIAKWIAYTVPLCKSRLLSFFNLHANTHSAPFLSQSIGKRCRESNGRLKV